MVVASRLYLKTFAKWLVKKIRLLAFYKARYPESLISKYKKNYPIALEITDNLVSNLKNFDPEGCAANSPASKNFDWEEFLKCRTIRMLKVGEFLQKIGPGLKVLDVGSYFGNFSLLAKKLGYSVDAIDSYKEYGHSFDFAIEELKKNQISVLDFADIGYDLAGLKKESYDVVLSISVIEHIPHTPRLFMESLCSVLKKGGHLILETPNLAYIYNRQKLKRGVSVFPPIQDQYFTEIPFKGHNREYTISEIEWIFKQNGLSKIALDTYNYSLHSRSDLSLRGFYNFYQMQKDPAAREIIIALGEKNG